MPANLAPNIDTQKEVRFAIVMYGGVSLAIYIHGVAKELLRLVRATGLDKDSSQAHSHALPADHLRGSELVYRKLSYLLEDEGKELAQAERELKNNETIRTRFVVDIVSGTSAGGINGVFLAKALANGQDMDALSSLWLEEGDINVLLNDRESVEQPFSLQEPPSSLLSSQRMYIELLKALDGMEGPQPSSAAAKGLAEASPDRCDSPYIDELDLFVTTTDIHGISVPLRLADKLVYERRYRNVFQFIYDDERNDFMGRYNPFLAYASRCTSSFPFAFEPMSLCDIDDVLPAFARYGEDELYQSGSGQWQRFFRDYLNPTGVRTVKFPDRAFGDGGYLDNKPFSYATETIARRGAAVPVDRKLIYIEPSPEHPENEAETRGKPDLIENVSAALFSLPRYEAIREDLQRIIERNRLTYRVSRILEGIERDVEHAQVDDRDPLKDEEWAKLDLAEMIKRKGRGYSAYHRLDVAAVTDDISQLVARLAGFDEKSDYWLAIRSLVRAWRDNTYREYGNGHGKPTMNQFLIDFGLDYSFRRLQFLRSKIHQFYRFDARSRALFGAPDLGWWPKDSGINPPLKQQLRQDLLSLNAQINEAHQTLRKQRRQLRSLLDANNPLRRDIQNSGIRPEDLEFVLDKSDSPQLAGDPSVEMEDACVQRAKQLLAKREDLARNFGAIAAKLSGQIKGMTRPADQRCLTILADPRQPLDPVLGEIRRRLRDYYQNYDDYDMITFPILYGTEAGEIDQTQIIRVSPEDAPRLIPEKETGCHKLAGIRFGHFGAFLQDIWRQSDILWGRLDGAERLVNALLPQRPNEAAQLVGEAQAAIVAETIERLGEEEANRLLIESCMRPRTGKPAPDVLTKFIATLKSGAKEPGVKKILDERIDDRKLRDFYLQQYDTASQLQPKDALPIAARATAVVGRIFDGLAKKYDQGTSAAAWVTRLARVFVALVEVAVPRSISNLVVRHWLKLLYLFEALAIIGGPLLGNPTVQNFGFKALSVTVAFHAAIRLLGDLMSGKLNRWRVVKAIILFVLLAIFLLGVFELTQHIQDDAAALLKKLITR